MELETGAMEGAFVRLEPARPDHREVLRAALDCDPENWEIQYLSARGAWFDGYWDALLHTDRRRSFVVVSRADGAVAGTSGFLSVDAANRTLEIGGTWFRPEYRGTAVNPEVKRLMLDRAFGAGAERVQFTVDARNTRSQAAMSKLGAIREGVLRRHLVTWTGHVRDSVVFSITADEWPVVRERLVRRVEEGGVRRPNLTAEPGQVAARPSIR
jgi:RimJ/RimL family protein N-acetyltransferase